MSKSKAKLRITGVLMKRYEEDHLEFLETNLDVLIENLLTIGPSALDQFQDILPDIEEVKSEICQKQDYFDYLKTIPELACRLEVIRSSPQLDVLIKEDPSEPDMFIKEAFEKLRKKRDEYDENFTLVYDMSKTGGLNDENLMLQIVQQKKENDFIKYLMLPIIQQNREKDFMELFRAFRPLLFDLLKRRGSLKNFIETLHHLSKSERIAAQQVIKKLEVKDLLILLVESCSMRSVARLASWFVHQFYPLPFVYPTGYDEYKINLECCLEFLFQTKKPLISSIGTKSCVGMGKSSLLSYLFSCKKPLDFSTRNGYTHFGSIDLYVNLPSEEQKYVVADLHSSPDAHQDGFNIANKVLKVSQLVLVHLTDKDITGEDLQINLDFRIDNNVKVFYLWRDFQEEKRKVLEKLKEGLRNNPNLLGIIPVSNLSAERNLSAEQNTDLQNEKYDILSMINEKIQIFENKTFAPLEELQKAFRSSLNKQEVNEPLSRWDLKVPVPIETDSYERVFMESEKIDQQRQKIRRLLDKTVGERKGENLVSSLFPCFWIDCEIIEERKRRKAIDRITPFKLADNEIQDLSQKYEEMRLKIEKLERQKENVEFGDLNQEIIQILFSDNLQRILLLAETISSWKKSKVSKEIKKFDKDDMITLHTFLDEIMGLCDSARNKNSEANIKKKMKNGRNLDARNPLKYYQTLALCQCQDDFVFTQGSKDHRKNWNNRRMSVGNFDKNKNLKGYKEIKQYLFSNLRQGEPINLVNGKTLKFGSKLLSEIFTEKMSDLRNIFVISIIGAQSSAKSTLLNMLFGCGFSTAAGRCTKGIYISLLNHPSGFRIMIIDTEGLLSVIARDHEFDNLITTMAFSCSHVIIINNKGEIDSKLKDLLEICVYAMKHLRLSSIKPKIVFALRDIARNSTETQQGILLQMKSSLEDAAKKLSIDINKLISFSKEDVFLMPSAFQPSEGENKMIVELNNNIFSNEVLKMRQYIFSYLSEIPRDLSIQSLDSFYELMKQLWTGITELGKDIMRAKNFLEIELKNDALAKVEEICQGCNELLRAKGQAILKYKARELNHLDPSIFEDNFNELLMKEFLITKDLAMLELNTTVCNNDKYAAIASSYSQEFREMVEYYLRWQNQRFIMDWNSLVLSWKTNKDLSDFKANLRQKINEKFRDSGSVEMKKQIKQVFGDIKATLKQQFEENHKKFCETKIRSLPAEIHKCFEGAQRIKNSAGNSLQVRLPTLTDFVERIDKKNGFISNDIQSWVKVDSLKEFNGIKTNEDHALTIKREFDALLKHIDTLITSEPSEDSALNILTACVSKIKDMEGRVPVYFMNFMFQVFLEAMYKQYSLKLSAEEAKMKMSHDSFEEILRKEEEYVSQLLEGSESSYNQGISCAKSWFEDARSKFYEKRGGELSQEILSRMREEFPGPESANKKAYDNSFKIRNYENVVKYVLEINKFIKEIYRERINIRTEQEIERNIGLPYVTLRKFKDVLIEKLNEWGLACKDEETSSLESFLPYISENEHLKDYLPDIYPISLKNIKVFVDGCIQELNKQITYIDLRADFKNILTKKLEDSLSAEYVAMMGCQETCPLCKNKCTRPNIVHTDHQTNCHLLLAFSGTRHYITDEANLTRCVDPVNYRRKWFMKEVEYKDYDEFIEKLYPTWRLDFPRKEKLDLKNSNVPQELIEGWVATRKVLTKRFGYVDKTPQNWIDQVESHKILNENIVIEGYVNDPLLIE